MLKRLKSQNSHWQLNWIWNFMRKKKIDRDTLTFDVSVDLMLELLSDENPRVFLLESRREVKSERGKCLVCYQQSLFCDNFSQLSVWETRRHFIEPVYFAQENLGDTLKEWMSMFLWTQFYYEINHGEQFHWNICNAGEESEKFYQSKCCCEKMKNILKEYFTINIKCVLHIAYSQYQGYNYTEMKFLPLIISQFKPIIWIKLGDYQFGP